MYQVGHRQKRHRRRVIGAAVGFLLLIIFATITYHYFQASLHSGNSITQAAAVTTKIASPAATAHTFTEPNFTIGLPAKWQETTHEVSPYNIYRWEDTGDKTNSRELEIYEDTIPQNFPINRALAVSANGDQVTEIGSVSDNCVDFTKSTAAAPSTGVHARWQGIDFLCDVNNYARNVVGTISANGINRVSLKGESGHSHLYFFTFTDRNIAPDYSAFYSALSAFKVK